MQLVFLVLFWMLVWAANLKTEPAQKGVAVLSIYMSQPEADIVTDRGPRRWFRPSCLQKGHRRKADAVEIDDED